MTKFSPSGDSREPSRLNGDGLQTRSFCHVTIFIDGLMMLDSIGGDASVLILEIGNYQPSGSAELIISITRSHSDVVNVETCER